MTWILCTVDHTVKLQTHKCFKSGLFFFSSFLIQAQKTPTKTEPQEQFSLSNFQNVSKENKTCKVKDCKMDTNIIRCFHVNPS